MVKYQSSLAALLCSAALIVAAPAKAQMHVHGGGSHGPMMSRMNGGFGMNGGFRGPTVNRGMDGRVNNRFDRDNRVAGRDRDRDRDHRDRDHDRDRDRHRDHFFFARNHFFFHDRFFFHPFFFFGASVFAPVPVVLPVPYPAYIVGPVAVATPPAAVASAPVGAVVAQNCYEFQTELEIDGQRQPAWGNTCKQADGSWRIEKG